MVMYCKACDEEYECGTEKCPACGGRLEEWYTEEEWEQIQKDNDEAAAINMLLF